MPWNRPWIGTKNEHYCYRTCNMEIMVWWFESFDGLKAKSKAGVRVVIISLVGHKVNLLFWLDFSYTNNPTKYKALIIGLLILLDNLLINYAIN